jgi:thiamine biosynthesis lipoprotein
MMDEAVFEARDFIMNTDVEQKIFGNTPDMTYSAAVKKLQELERIMSFYRKTSEVSLLNRFAGKSPVKVSGHLMSVLEQSQKCTALSENAFNIMLAPLVQLWRKSGARNSMPSRGSIQKARALCKNENLVLDKNEHTAYLTKKGCMVDLGGIGKGFAADVCCDIYRESGASSAFINLGGNVKTIGNHPDGKRWTIGIRHPDRSRGSCYGVIMCSGRSVVTSGAYERYQEINGAKYHHIIDGKTGYPSETDLKSATVISQSSLQADALSTAAFVLGLGKGVDLIYDSTCTGAIFFTKEDKVYLTKGVKQHVGLLEKLPCYEI